ncbi:MAG: hypothetical protein GX242_03595 [Clostridiales bacterium]|nr:hypothetical protein [Clostridiales bacterium]
MTKDKNKTQTREQYNLQMHNYGRIFSWISMALILFVPVAYFIASKTVPSVKALVKCIPFLLGYFAVGLVEAVSYAPLLGPGGQYMSFITGNISNLKLPCSINSQAIAKVKQGSEEQELVSTVSIAVSSITTTIIIVIGLIPLFIFQEQIVTILNPISPYVIPAIFGGLTVVLAAKYYKTAAIPFISCIIICVGANLAGFGKVFDQSTMVIVGMIVSGLSTFILYKKNKI